MQKLKAVFYSLILLAVALAFLWRGSIIGYLKPKIRNVEKAAFDTLVGELKKEVIAPPPLIATKATPASTSAPAAPERQPSLLDASGTIKWTNIQRENNGLAPLAESGVLDEIAVLRLEDMFKNQYFAHVSPAGAGAESVAREVGYDYISLGENLALGDFQSDEKLVEAWMSSPGHRENILNTGYREIGVAVKKGIFSAEGVSGGRGEETWIAVQIFGKPASACPTVDAALKLKIDSAESQLESWQATLKILQSDIESTPPRNPSYNSKVDAYNSLADQYNALLSQTKSEIVDYNNQVAAFNKCIAK
jgi:uncharacterized protein YkwD